MQETWVLSPGSRRSSREGNGYTLQYSHLKKPHRQRSLGGYSPWRHKAPDMAGWLPATSIVMAAGAKQVGTSAYRGQAGPYSDRQ